MTIPATRGQGRDREVDVRFGQGLLPDLREYGIGHRELGKPLTDDELRLIAGYPRQLALLFPGQVPGL